MSSQPYDPYQPSGNGAGSAKGPRAHVDTEQLQQEIDGATAKMQHNVDKLAQRGENLNSLQDKTDNLAVSAQGFNQGANRVRQKMWRSNMKWKIALIVGIIVLLCIIIIPIATHFK
ncbi:hypothetical protein V499_00252 [Pseudogymnoascus sp. VKM F-103]|uniref:V-SNARE coiled-coil homology domain-containing protein n=1 Tax=Pseudogymnoascus verrucosus TaxID=342668 RepID=A0A1B8GP86_9PEZI|nr:uncharacterized protein VE01_04464 [Pseudogymnoascus verrucosus]KFY80957.1 hypothetical protein V499_00252 [Pseudogymnoascus sp. VKM F-103]OBT97649.2 hypothetical protein VE01_04464 [Pseudogymnoascus verrucosus]